MSAATPWNDKPNTRTVELPINPAMTERTYGLSKRTVSSILSDELEKKLGSAIYDMAAHIRDLQAENARLNEAIKWEQHREGRAGTHADGCHAWGPNHYECLLREQAKLSKEHSACANLCQDLERKNEELYQRIDQIKAENAKLKANQGIAFVGVDPFNPEKGAVHPMIPDSWRYGFVQHEDGLLFTLRDNGPFVAVGALRDEVEKLKAERREFADKVALAVFTACEEQEGSIYGVDLAAIVEQALSDLQP